MKAYGKLTAELTGSASRLRRTPQVPRVGPEPPSWWIDDLEATESNFAAMAALGGGVPA